MYLILENRTAPVGETIIRFFSYFTILTNTLAALYFTCRALQTQWLKGPGTLTAITVYITIVGAVYQVLLRHLWQPQGLQLVVDEMLHTVNPLLVIGYWYLFEVKEQVRYAQIKWWLVYPLVYLLFILARGSFSRFYPYPFIDVAQVGLTKALTNAAFLLLFFIAVSVLLVYLGRVLSRRVSWQQTGN